MNDMEAIARGEQAIAEGQVATYAQARTRLTPCPMAEMAP